MKKWLSAIFVSCLVSSTLLAQFPVTGNWLLRTGDDAAWASPAYSADTAWSSIQVPATWESRGFTSYDGFAWYRIKFIVSDRLLESQEKRYLVAGFIDDVDQIFLNGTLLGQTGKFPPEYSTEYSDLRKYLIPPESLRKENVLAIRVYDGGGPGGIYRGPVGLYTGEQIEHLFQVTSTPHRSFYQLPSSNGLLAAVYDSREHAITQVLNHIYKQYNEEKSTTNLLRSAYYNVQLDTTQYDLATFSEDQTEYETGTGIIHSVFKLDPTLTLNTFHFAPFGSNERIVVSIAELTGAGVKDASLKYRIKQLEPTAVHLSQTYDYDDDRSVQVNVIGWHPKGKNAILQKMQQFLVDYPGMTSLYEEREFWNSWHANGTLPQKLSTDEKNLALQSTAMLKMGQVREQGKGFGQILASLPPGNWNISWVRDMAYAVEALVQTGHYQEARDALAFQLKANVGEYEHFLWSGKDYGIQHPYQISVCRYYGNGNEWSDHNQDGPNIELDGFGLFLWTLESYMNASDDVPFIREHWELISRRIADPLIANIDGYGIIREDSGPWERHLPGKHFTYTSVAAIRGLDAAANMALAVNQDEQADEYLEAANRISQGFRLYLIDPKKDAVKGNLNAAIPEKYVDGAVVESVNWILDNDNSRARNTMQLFNTHLKMDKTKHGYKRIPSGDWYDRQEWIVLNLRIASAWFKLQEKYRGNEVLDWVTQQSILNYGLIAELYDEYTVDYRGATPMIGFGAGAYLLALKDRVKFE